MTLLARTLDTLVAASAALRASVPGACVCVALVDNSDTPEGPALAPLMKRLRDAGMKTQYIAGHGNVGYGRGHNLALDSSDDVDSGDDDDDAGGTHARTGASRYHLILNPDIELEAQALVQALDFMESHPSVGLLAPWTGDEQGHCQYLCRRYPSVFDLLLRGFMPHGVRQLFAARLARYEMRDVMNDTDVVWEPPIISGCFMLFRTDVLKKLGGFDPRYFLYFEDYDLSLRAHAVTQVACVPAVRVTHHGGGAGRKGAAHIRMFMVSAWRFFNRFGWKWI
jgi:GT2 family glycosyltransferase